MSGWVEKRPMAFSLGMDGDDDKENWVAGRNELRYGSAKGAMMEGERQRVQSKVNGRQRPNTILGARAADDSHDPSFIPDDFGGESEEEIDSSDAEGMRFEESREEAEDQFEESLSTDNITHSEAYTEMTRGAVPLPQNPQNTTYATSSRKRHLPLEVSGSETSSSIESLSPYKYPELGPERPMKRLCTPQSEHRRYSAPSHVMSPLKLIDPNRLQKLDNSRGIELKNDNTRSSLAWLVAGIERLRAKYPDDYFEAENCLIKCVDCDGRTFKPGSNNSVHNFETHLRSKSHKANVDARILHEDHENTIMPASKPNDFENPTHPAKIFAQTGQPDLEAARASYLLALQNDASSKALTINTLQVRLASLERKLTAQVDHVTEILKESKRNEEKYQSLSQWQSVSESKNANNLADIEGRLSRQTVRQEDNIAELANRISLANKQREELLKLGFQLTDIAEKSSDEVKELNREIARSEKTNWDGLEAIRRTIAIVEDGSKEQFNQLGGRIIALEALASDQNDHIHDIEAKYQLHAEKFDKQFASEERMRQDLLAQVTAHFMQTGAKLKTLEENEREMKRMHSKSTERIRILERTNCEQQCKIEGFEALFPAILEDASELRQYVETMSGVGQEEETQEEMEPDPGGES